MSEKRIILAGRQSNHKIHILEAMQMQHECSDVFETSALDIFEGKDSVSKCKSSKLTVITATSVDELWLADSIIDGHRIECKIAYELQRELSALEKAELEDFHIIECTY
jgi:hypothetical protein